MWKSTGLLVACYYVQYELINPSTLNSYRSINEVIINIQEFFHILMLNAFIGLAYFVIVKIDKDFEESCSTYLRNLVVLI